MTIVKTWHGTSRDYVGESPKLFATLSEKILLGLVR